MVGCSNKQTHETILSQLVNNQDQSSKSRSEWQGISTGFAEEARSFFGPAM
jgi:hypothetical protein